MGATAGEGAAVSGKIGALVGAVAEMFASPDRADGRNPGTPGAPAHGGTAATPGKAGPATPGSGPAAPGPGGDQ